MPSPTPHNRDHCPVQAGSQERDGPLRRIGDSHVIGPSQDDHLASLTQTPGSENQVGAKKLMKRGPKFLLLP